MRAVEDIVFQVGDLKLAAKHWRGPSSHAPRLLALHGWLDNAESFTPLAPYLASWEIVAVDLPGHGRSQHKAAHASYHFIDWVVTVHGILDKLGWPRCVLMGHSMGAGISTLTAGTLPERVCGLVLLDALAPYTAEAEAMPQRLRAYIADNTRRSLQARQPYPDVEAIVTALRNVLPNLSKANAELLVGRNTCANPDGRGVVWRTDVRLRSQSVMTLTDAQLNAFLDRIVCPGVVVRAPDGHPWNEATFEAQVRRIPSLTLTHLGGGHHVHMESPQAVAKLIEPTLVQCRPEAIAVL